MDKACSFSVAIVLDLAVDVFPSVGAFRGLVLSQFLEEAPAGRECFASSGKQFLFLFAETRVSKLFCSLCLVSLVVMLHRIRAMFARVQAGDLTAKIVGGLGFITVGGIAVRVNSMDFLHTVRQARKEDQERDRRYLQEMQDRRRSVDRLVKSAFFAEPPIVEIPRKAAEAGRALVVGSLVSAVHELLAPG